MTKAEAIAVLNTAQDRYIENYISSNSEKSEIFEVYQAFNIVRDLLEKEETTKHRHICNLGFNVISDDENGEDLTPEMYRIAIKETVDQLDRFNMLNSVICIVGSSPIREEDEE